MSKSLLLAIGLLVLALAAGSAEAVQYRIVDLGMLPGGSYSVANGINSSGQVVGTSYSSTGVGQAFIWSGGVMTPLGMLSGASNSLANAINNQGQVVGSSGGHAFIWQSNVMTDISGGSYNYATAISSNGKVAGYTNSLTGFVWANGQMVSTIVDSNPGYGQDWVWSSIEPTGITDSGEVVGWGSYGNRYFHNMGAFEWLSGTPEFMGFALSDRGPAINNAGQFAFGEYVDSTFLGLLPGASSCSANAINNLGQVVGSSGASTQSEHAFIWQNSVMTDLGTLGQGVYSQATGVADNGWVCGIAKDGSGVSHAVVWVPVPEPSSFFALGLGILPLIAVRRRG